MPGSHLTVLRSAAGILSTKRWLADGTIEQYGKARNFAPSVIPLDGLSSLYERLLELSPDRQAFVVRGLPRNHDPDATILRRSALFDDRPVRWMMVDVDSFEPISCDPWADPVTAAQEFISTRLPSSFQDISYVLQLSASHGHPSTAGKLKAHLWYWLSAGTCPEGYTSAQLRAWARSLPGAPVDPAVYRTVQPHYTASPALGQGVADPFAGKRVRYVQGVVSDELPLALTPDQLAAVEDRVALDRARRAGDVDDPAVQWLVEHDRVRGYDQHTGVLYVYCPWRDQHASGDGAESSTAYFPAGVGRSEPGYKCLHAGCGERSDAREYLRAAGVPQEYWPEVRDFEPVTEEDRHAAVQQETAAAEQECDKLRQQLEQEEDPRAIEKMLVPAICRNAVLEEQDVVQLLTIAHRKLKAAARVTKRLDVWVKAQLTKYPRDQQARRQTPVDTRKPMPKWAEGWGRLADSARWIHPSTGQRVDDDGLRVELGHNLPRNPETGTMQDVAHWLMEHCKVPLVSGTVFSPSEGAFIDVEGRTLANVYKPGEAVRPKPRTDWTEEDKAAVLLVEDLIHKLVPGDRERSILMSWVSHAVCKPGEKMLWAVHLAGSFGVGKSFLFELMRTLIGPSNTRLARNSELQEKYNGWAVDGCLVGLDEIEEADNKRELVDSMKNLITGSITAVRRMQTDTVDTPNHANYFATTNSILSLPLPPGDRRWLVVQASPTTAQAAEWDWDSAFSYLDTHGPAIRQWLQDLPVHPEFKPRGHAPTTKWREYVIASGRSGASAAASELLERVREGKRLRGVTADGRLLVGTVFFEQVQAFAPHSTGSGHRSYAHVLIELEYEPYDEPGHRLYSQHNNRMAVWKHRSLPDGKVPDELWAELRESLEDPPITDFEAVA